MTPRLKFGLIGTGSFGSYFASYLIEAGELAAVCDPDGASLARFAEAGFAAIPAFRSAEELLGRVDADAIVITTPNYTHRDLTVQAAQAGKHVFCEKAMANTTAECWQMVRACEDAGVKLMVGHKRRLRPPWERPIQLRETLGDVCAISMNLYYDARPYNHAGWWTKQAECGGTLGVAGVHEIDWMRALCGDVASVSAVSGPRLAQRYDFPDTLHLTIEFISGAIASLNISIACPLRHFREASRPVILYRGGAARLDPAQEYIDLYWRSNGDESDRFERFDDLGFDHAYRREVTDFVRWIQMEQEPCLTWREGFRCVEVIEAARHSLEAGGGKISLPLVRV